MAFLKMTTLFRKLSEIDHCSSSSFNRQFSKHSLDSGLPFIFATRPPSFLTAPAPNFNRSKPDSINFSTKLLYNQIITLPTSSFFLSTPAPPQIPPRVEKMDHRLPKQCRLFENVRRWEQVTASVISADSNRPAQSLFGWTGVDGLTREERSRNQEGRMT